ncbi:MAG: PEP-CTERM sorting domain-containing protein [Kiritimatiellae bacterium]|nr:PEP-CTERM sorting domain-containing protein [Kiritimatiellia bacterium]MDW8459202.1 PEP-CTERM sorting domain-containing protein [Verrucomicrobiota bacterium]
MRKLLLAVGSLCMVGVVSVSALLSPGDILIIMANSDAPDSFAWVPLVNIPANTTISFTDSSYGSGDGSGITNTNFRWSEHLDTSGGGPLTWTYANPLAAGTVIIFNGTTWNIGTGSGSFMNLATAGDQIFAFTGPVVSNPVPGQYSGIITGLLYGVQFSGGNWITNGLGTTSASYLPSMLSGANVALGTNDNWIYVGIRTGTPAELLAAVNDPANWQSDNVNPYSWTFGNFEVVPEPATVALAVIGMSLAAIFRRRYGV